MTLQVYRSKKKGRGYANKQGFLIFFQVPKH